MDLFFFPCLISFSATTSPPPSETLPDVLTAVKILAGSTVEIAAASVGEKSLVNAVQQIQENGKVLDSAVEVVQPEILEATADVEAEKATVVMNEGELKSAEAGAAAADEAEADDSEEVTAEESSAPTVAEEVDAAASSPDKVTASAQTVEEVEAEDQALDPNAVPKEDLSSTEASPEDAATTTAEAPPADDASPGEMTPAADTSVEEETAEASGEETAEAASTHSEGAAVVDTAQLAAASTVSKPDVLSAAQPQSEARAHEAKHCHSCNSAAPPEEVAPPALVEGELVSDGAVDIKQSKNM